MATFKMMCLLVAVAAFVVGARAEEAECTNSVVATLQEKVSQVTTDVNSNLSVSVRNPPLATENLLENTDGVYSDPLPRPPPPPP